MGKIKAVGTLDIFNIPCNFFISESKEYFYSDGNEVKMLSTETFQDRMIILQFVRDGGEVFYSFKTDKQEIFDRFKRLEKKISDLETFENSDFNRKILEFVNVNE